MKATVLKLNGLSVERRSYSRHSAAELFMLNVLGRALAEGKTFHEIVSVVNIVIASFEGTTIGSSCFGSLDPKAGVLTVYGQGGRLLFSVTFEKANIFSHLKSWFK